MNISIKEFHEKNLEWLNKELKYYSKKIGGSKKASKIYNLILIKEKAIKIRK